VNFPMKTGAYLQNSFGSFQDASLADYVLSYSNTIKDDSLVPCKYYVKVYSILFNNKNFLLICIVILLM